MKTKNIKNTAASVRNRLLNISKDLDIDFNRVLLLYVQERFLFRLKHSKYSENFVLKGGVLFYGVFKHKARPTKDIDFLVSKIKNDKDTINKVVSEILTQQTADGLEFDRTSLTIEEIADDSEYHGLRLKVSAFLEKAHVVLQLDFGFGDIIFPRPVKFNYPSLLEDNPFRIYTYSWESVIAEKFEAIVSLGDLNSRMKDFFDLNFIIQRQDFVGQYIQNALGETFNNRGTALGDYKYIFSSEFKNSKDKQTQWSAFLRKHRLEPAPSFEKVIENIQYFIEPVILMELENKQIKQNWDAQSRIWVKK